MKIIIVSNLVENSINVKVDLGGVNSAETWESIANLKQDLDEARKAFPSGAEFIKVSIMILGLDISEKCSFDIRYPSVKAAFAGSAALEVLKLNEDVTLLPGGGEQSEMVHLSSVWSSHGLSDEERKEIEKHAAHLVSFAETAADQLYNLFSDLELDVEPVFELRTMYSSLRKLVDSLGTREYVLASFKIVPVAGCSVEEVRRELKELDRYKETISIINIVDATVNEGHRDGADEATRSLSQAAAAVGFHAAAAAAASASSEGHRDGATALRSS